MATRQASQGTLAQLSREALRAAEGLGLLEPPSVARFLYEFNRADPPDDWAGGGLDAEAVRALLSIGSGTRPRSILDEHWVEIDPAAVPGWLVWAKPTGGHEVGAPGPELKLYVSPDIESLGAVFEAIVPILASSRARSFKVGANASGLLRPDKIVVYFSDLGDLAATAQRLTDRLRGVPAQGVPFTSEIGGDGLLSWSVDPPAGADPSSQPRPTWRTWITNRAARALIAARRESDVESPPWRRALECLRDEGIDVERWLPATTQWSSRGAWR